MCVFFFFQAEDGIRDKLVTGVQTCALPISSPENPDLPVPATVEITPDFISIFRITWLSRSATKRSPCESKRSSRSEEHTSELQSLAYLVCRLLLEKKKKHIIHI